MKSMVYKMSLSAMIGILTLPLISATSAPRPYQYGVVASDHKLASQAGLDVLKNGGNAIDAAIATSFVLSVIRNQSTGIGGGGFMLIHTAKGDDLIIDSREIAPKKAHSDMYLDRNKKPIKGLSTRGYQAVGIPGLLSGLDYAATHYGTRSLKTLMQPAIQYAEKGFPIDHHFAHASQVVAKRGVSSDIKGLFFNAKGEPKQWGDIQTHPELAKTLRLIANSGIDTFYKGAIAQKIVKAMQANRGYITADDLANYRPRIRKPLKGRYHGYEILTMPPPSSGGTALLEMLNFLEPFHLSWKSTGHSSSQYVHLITEAMKHAFSDRANYLGDPDFVKVPLAELISKPFAQQLRHSFQKEHTLKRERYGKNGLTPGSVAYEQPKDAGTTHFSVMDRYGNVVSSTETINTYFGSQVVVPGTGILLNNEMDDFSKQPGVPNAFGLIGNQANAIVAGKKPLSSMTPTIVLKNGKPFMAVGASGGPRIITGTLHAILNVIDFDMNANEAVSAPRFHHQWVPNRIYIEKDMPLDVRHNLRKKGHALKKGSAENVVQAVIYDHGKFTGASDPRKGGEPAGY